MAFWIYQYFCSCPQYSIHEKNYPYGYFFWMGSIYSEKEWKTRYTHKKSSTYLKHRNLTTKKISFVDVNSEGCWSGYIRQTKGIRIGWTKKINLWCLPKMIADVWPFPNMRCDGIADTQPSFLPAKIKKKIDFSPRKPFFFGEKLKFRFLFFMANLLPMRKKVAVCSTICAAMELYRDLFFLKIFRIKKLSFYH